jgi:hypothetical protein
LDTTEPIVADAADVESDEQQATEGVIVSEAPVSETPVSEERAMRPVEPEVFCEKCMCIHEGSRCLRDPRASAPERHGRRIAAETTAGLKEIHGALIAPVDGRWRARLLTYPRTLWTYPGRPVTMKFIADGPVIAETMAVDFLLKHLAERGDQIIDSDMKVTVDTFDQEVRNKAAVRSEVRKLNSTFVEFGVKPPWVEAETADMSERGLFIVTEEMYPKQTLLKIFLNIESCRMPLKGVVTWQRKRSSPGRPQGLGIQLIGPPALYTHYVEKLP